MKRIHQRRWSVCLAICFACGVANAAEPEVVPLWAGGAPGFEDRRDEAEVTLDRGEPEYATFKVTTNIHNPSLLAFLPEPDKTTGAALIIAPGGGHMFLTMGREGADVAEWFRARGVAAFVLKYRLARAENSPYNLEHCVEDGRRAVRLVRSRAAEWGVDPARVGLLGFSAGGRVALMTGAAPGETDAAASDPIDRLSARPDFIASIYGETPRETTVTAQSPPAFLLVAGDDDPKAAPLVRLYLQYKEAGVPAELHVYARGGHGFGIAERPVPIAHWPDRLLEWIDDAGFLQARAP